MRSRGVGVQGKHALISIARGVRVAQLELHGTEHHEQLGLFGSQHMGTRNQRCAFGQITAHASHGAEATQGFAVVRIALQRRAVSSFGFFQATLAMEFDGFSKHGELALWAAGAGAT